MKLSNTQKIALALLAELDEVDVGGPKIGLRKQRPIGVTVEEVRVAPVYGSIPTVTAWALLDRRLVQWDGPRQRSVHLTNRGATLAAELSTTDPLVALWCVTAAARWTKAPDSRDPYVIRVAADDAKSYGHTHIDDLVATIEGARS